tara:strand:+ start:143 stop:676 length:534 start_codon:yes stop_codon:yes gene_type:complete
MNELQLIEKINSILREEKEGKSSSKKSDKPKKKRVVKIKPGEIGLSVGQGGFTKSVADAGALATQNPKKLMDNLKIEKGGKGLNGVVSVVNQAIKGAAAMSNAYGGFSKISKGGKTGYSLSMGVLDARNGAKFIHHTLMGAKNAGILSSDEPIQVQVVGDEVIIYSSEIKNSWTGAE